MWYYAIWFVESVTKNRQNKYYSLIIDDHPLLKTVRLNSKYGEIETYHLIFFETLEEVGALSLKPGKQYEIMDLYGMVQP